MQGLEIRVFCVSLAFSRLKHAHSGMERKNEKMNFMLKKNLIAYAALGLAAACSPLFAQPKPFATGLLNPAKLIQGPQGTFLVTEFGDTANSGRVSIVSSTGTRRTLIDGLPSGIGDQGP